MRVDTVAKPGVFGGYKHSLTGTLLSALVHERVWGEGGGGALVRETEQQKSRQRATKGFLMGRYKYPNMHNVPGAAGERLDWNFTHVIVTSFLPELSILTSNAHTLYS